MHELFEGFLKDSATYQACEQFWKQLAMSIAQSVESATDWRSWIPRVYADGTSIERDGNPIWEGRSDELDRAYRIIQDRDAGNEVEIGAWLKSYEEQYAELPRHELFIHLSLSQESVSIAETLLRKWMSRATTVEDMKTFIAEVIPLDSHGDDREC